MDKEKNVQAKNTKLLEEKIDINLADLGLGDDFYNMTPKVQATKEKIYWNSSKVKIFVL